MLYAYRILPWLYAALPVLAATLAVRAARGGKSVKPLQSFFASCLTGTLIGLGLLFIYVRIAGANVTVAQGMLACYAAIAVLCGLKLFNRGLAWGLGRIFRIEIQPNGVVNRPAVAVAAAVVQALVLLAVCIPYLLGLALVYRPRAVSGGDPRTQMGVGYEVVDFSATDGTPLEGWWIPAARTGRTDGRGSVPWGGQTVILCHGFGADKAKHLFLARDLVPNGYNVLAIDFRAHGRSGGQITGFGDLERRDVLGAVRWLRANHAAQSGKIFGLGESLGAAALIAAAADPSAEGQALDAIAVYNPYDDLGSLVRDTTGSHFAGPAAWLAADVALPMAGAQVGVDFRGFSPASDVQALWPRPLLVLQGGKDHSVWFPHGVSLFDNAAQPKYHYLIADDDRDGILSDDNASLAVRVFFSGAKSIL